VAQGGAGNRVEEFGADGQHGLIDVEARTVQRYRLPVRSPRAEAEKSAGCGEDLSASGP
jgi:hypothetical protein